MDELLNIAKTIYGFAGLMSGKLGDYPFVLLSNNYKKLDQSYEANFSSYQPIEGQKVLLDKVSHSHTIILNGVLVSKSTVAMYPLEKFLKEGETLRFTTLTMDIDVRIKSLKIVKTHFAKFGEHRVESYNIVLEEEWKRSDIDAPIGTGLIWWL